MRKIIFISILSLLILSACSNKVVYEANNDNLLVDNLQQKSSIDIGQEIIEEGAVCIPYSPKGQVIYDFEGNDNYPEIEKNYSDFETATFGLG